MTDDTQIQRALKECEAKFLNLFRGSPLCLVLTSASDNKYIEINDTFEHRTGWTRGEVIGRTASDINIWVDVDERIEFLKQLLSEGTVRNFELRGRMKNGEIRTGLASAALLEINGETCALTLIEDTTDFKGAEEAKRVAEQRFSNVIPRLLRAHDEEQTSTVRELHKYNNILMLLSIGLDRIQETLPQSVPAIRQEIREARKQVEDLFRDIQTLTHRLRSPKLEYVGLVSAATSFCREFSAQKNIQIDFAAAGVPEELPHRVTRALFYVLQEAVQNAAAYSGSQEIHVMLKGGVNQVDLTVRDSGIGFVADEALKGSGLGLTVMKERMKMVDGELLIESEPQLGTTITARVPLNTQSNTATSR